MARRRLHRRRRRREQPELLRRTHTFKGANFDYLAANVKYAGTNTDDPPRLHGQERSAAPRSASSA